MGSAGHARFDPRPLDGCRLRLGDGPVREWRRPSFGKHWDTQAYNKHTRVDLATVALPGANEGDQAEQHQVRGQALAPVRATRLERATDGQQRGTDR